MPLLPILLFKLYFKQQQNTGMELARW